MDDNWPKFDQVRWHKRLKEVLYRKGRRLDLPKARDADILDEHSRIHYRLESSESITGGSVPDVYDGPFKLEVTATGQPGLILTEDLDAEVIARHQMVLAAVSPSVVFAQPIQTSSRQYPKGFHNSIQSPTTARLLIDIEVADMNDNEPRFNAPLYNVSVTEDTPPDTVIYEVIAYDPDSTSQLTYSMGSSAESAVLDATFTVQSDGRIRLRSYLDYELRHLYKVPVKVSDGEFTTQTHLLVHVLDVNDEPPEFEINPKQLVADENASVGKLIGRIRVRDPDGEAVNGQIQCWEPAHVRRQQVLSFLPDPNTNPLATVYDLTTRVVLDREAVTESDPGLLFVYLICSDGHGLSERKSLSASQHTATMTATLSVRDNNDHRPMFSQSTYHVTINENNPIGEKVIQVNATDADEGENAKITYSLLDRANFKVDSITGWITANMVFDRETRDSYQVTVIAMDHGKPRLSSSVLLNLTVMDTNDHRPQLASYETDAHLLDHASLQSGRVGFGNLFAVKENLPANSYVGDVLAKDDDIGQNAQLHFELVNDMLTQYSTRFRLLRNGSLYTTIELDREEKGLDKEQLQSSTPVGATSVNPTLKLSVYEKPGQLLTNLHAKDPDAGANGRVIYELVEFFKFPAQQEVLLNPLIRVQPEQGDVILQRHMSQSDLGLHFFEVSASDGGKPEPKLDSKVLVVLVEDVPATGTRPVAALASSYYSNNRTSVEVDLWGFEGKSNMFIITVLASVSGLLAIVLVTAILCVVRPCGKNRGALCGRRRRERRNRSRPITSPGCSDTGNGFGMRAAGMDGDGDGSVMPYGFPALNGHANNPYPGLHSAEVDPSLLLPSADDWHPHCGNDGCGYGNVTYPYRHANATQTTQSSQRRLQETAAISQQFNTKNEAGL
ncbi:protocadherin delta 1 [Paragonimus westermani]|uniref:Protocadherin delta 1 n=1 Tax=Paragonimus westermani TaxID=34504 RepID=A0A5J4NET4_9TREM|nr:protocadherin delta 1 [Paragonimus westermani]